MLQFDYEKQTHRDYLCSYHKDKTEATKQCYALTLNMVSIAHYHPAKTNVEFLKNIQEIKL